MALVRDRCICLRKVEYSETSQVLTLFGQQHGLVRALAKGAHRTTKQGASRFGGGIDLLDLGQAVLSVDPGKELGLLTEWTLLDGHLDLRRELRRLYLAQYAAELVSLLIEEHDPHAELFARFEHALNDLQAAGAEEAFLAFELDLLRETGYLAELSRCAGCGSMPGEQESAWFSPARGGIICRNCHLATPDRIAIDPRLLRMVRGMLALPRGNGAASRLPRLSRRQTDPVNHILAEHIEHTLGKRMRLTQYVLAPRKAHR